MAKKIELGQSGLGDIWDVLHNRGVSDLSWLDIDPEDYHKAEALPKQNLDIIPELQRALTFEDSDVPKLIPLRPHTMVNTNPLDPPGAPARNVAPEIVNRVARHLMSGHPPKHIKERIFLEFSPSQVRAASSGISSVMSERGLLGNVFIDARHFPRCAQDGDDKKFVAARASGAQYILAKSECSGCIHNKCGNCANLHKRLVDAVSYDRRMFASYAVQLAEQGRLDKSELDKAITGSDTDRKRVLQISFCSNVKQRVSDGHGGLTLRHQDKVAKPTFSDQEIVEHLSKPKQAAAALSRSFIAASRHLMFGGAPDAISGSADPEVQKLVKSHGILGHTYLDMDALGGCQKTLDFISRMDAAPDFIIRRSANCEHCKDMSGGGCHQVRMVAPITDDDSINKEHFVAALLRAADRGAITMDMVRKAAEKAPKNSNWKSLTAQANLLQAKKAEVVYAGAKLAAHHGAAIPSREMTSTRPVDAGRIRKAVSHMMNAGMSGRSLRDSILQKFSREDLVRVSHIGAELSRYDGVQGKYFIDPTAYSDYGRGCAIGSKHFRKIGAPNVLVGEACTGCSMQTAPGWCSKYSKPLIRSVPDHVIAAATELRKAPPIEAAPIENPVTKYELSSEMTVEPDKREVTPDIDFASRDITE